MTYQKIEDVKAGNLICKKYLSANDKADLEEKVIELLKEKLPKGTYMVGVELDVLFDVQYEPGKRPDAIYFKSWTLKSGVPSEIVAAPNAIVSEHVIDISKSK